MQALPFSVAALAATELQFCPHALKLRLLRVLKLLRLSHLHHGIKDHIHQTNPSLSFSPTLLRSSSPAVVLLVCIPLGLPAFLLPFLFLFVFPADTFRTPLLSTSCCALYAGSGVSPSFVPQRQPTLVMLAHKHTRNVCLLSGPYDHVAGGVLAQDALARTALWSMMMKPYLSANGHRDPKQANGNDSG
ncbi:hypothetical protein O181_059632 [Austropuccinia psidii MF-1]|uniref:Uncharacterized protein n=1 Tax=Austropuccinia psidii MF-1 TaxID=1389203 RepID=A0A9Q3EM06_9BASI|nr:hypothetical protein [Austropuccinia psidii MF-1]